MQDKEKIETYEIRMRIRSVGTLCALAFIFLYLMADFEQRREVGIFRWFGL